MGFQPFIPRTAAVVVLHHLTHDGVGSEVDIEFVLRLGAEELVAHLRAAALPSDVGRVDGREERPSRVGFCRQERVGLTEQGVIATARARG